MPRARLPKRCADAVTDDSHLSVRARRHFRSASEYPRVRVGRSRIAGIAIFKQRMAEAPPALSLRPFGAALPTRWPREIIAARGTGYALWAESMEAIQKCGTMIKSPSGYPVQSPYVAIANRQAEIMMRIASDGQLRAELPVLCKPPAAAMRTVRIISVR